ncbi:ubiquinone-dependent pyruvate dehydrogenase [Burkholderia multivorans]|uniref:thiamine pyrophosphate-dependent enzyme n=1 Tax=Burkholderia multivorans TaxID=87883 RepID=UPI001C953EA2|nr:thiamine pyrophosphate-dependent enzyme [Burkholderia multivorans]MBY4673925.1 ubiquinone-dependent pyruvate dehydrogenase [Burkholderia multivorans]
MAKRKVADIIVDVLEAAGVKHCYGVVGDTLNHVTDAIRRSAIDWVHVRHEEAGAFAAGAEAYMTGQLTACAGSCGPGSLHFINGIYESHRNRAPVVLIASQVASTELGIDFPQEVEFRPIYQHCSVFCETIWNPGQTRRMVTLAAQAALTRRGVAVLVVPGDIASMEVEDGPAYSVHVPSPVTRPSDAELDSIAALLNAGSRIAVYAGAGCEHAHDQVVRLCETLKAPMAHTSRAKDFVEYDNPYNVGMTGVFGSKAGFQTVMQCDTLVLLGCDFAWRQFYPPNAKVVQIDLDPTHLGRRHPVDVGVVGDIAATLEALQPRLKPHTDRGFLDKALTLHREVLEGFAEQAAPGRDGLIHPQQVAALLDRHAEDDAIFTADGGSPMVWVLRYIRTNGQRRTLTSLLHGTMANAMPQALGIKKALPQRQVVALCGDGGLSMLLGDLLTAVQENIPYKLVVFNNGTLGFVELEMKVEGLLNAYTDLKNPDFGKLAEVIGLRGWTVERNEQLESTMQEFLAHPGPALLNVHVNPNELVMPPKIEPAMVVGTAIYGAKAILDGRIQDVADLLSTNFLR